MIVDQHPADRRKPDDHRGRDRPCADADIADSLPFGFILGDFTVSLLVLALAHRLPSPSSRSTCRSRFQPVQPSLDARRRRWTQARLERLHLRGTLAAASQPGDPPNGFSKP